MKTEVKKRDIGSVANPEEGSQKWKWQLFPLKVKGQMLRFEFY